MKKQFILILGCALCVTLCFGQGDGQGSGKSTGQGAEKSTGQGSGKSTWKFRSDEYLGTVSGQMGSYGLVETVNGVYKGPWFLGLGTGLDYYRYRSVPLFLSVTRDLLGAPKIGKLYVLANGGINFPWYNQAQLPYGVKSIKFYPGVWWNAGLGYRARLSRAADRAILFSVSYGMKKLSERQKGQTICPTCYLVEVQNPPTNEYEYLNRVLLFAVGFQF